MMHFLFVILIACHVNLLFVKSANCAIEINSDEQAIEDANQSTEQVPIATNVDHSKLPTILIVTLFRNKAHTMPLFFTYLDRLDYPKKRISLWLVLILSTQRIRHFAAVNLLYSKKF